MALVASLPAPSPCMSLESHSLGAIWADLPAAADVALLKQVAHQACLLRAEVTRRPSALDALLGDPAIAEWVGTDDGAHHLS